MHKSEGQYSPEPLNFSDFKNHWAITRNIEGEPIFRGDSHTAEAFRDLKKTFFPAKEVIGISVRGSTAEGYAKPEKDVPMYPALVPDIDAFILLDEAKFNPSDRLTPYGPINIPEHLQWKYDQVKAASQGDKIDYGRPIVLQNLKFLLIGRETLLKRMEQLHDDIKLEKQDTDSPLWMEIFALSSLIATNKDQKYKIDDYRKPVVDVLTAWTPEEREKFIDTLLKFIDYRESHSRENKKKERLEDSGLTLTEINEINAKRKDFWGERLRKIWLSQNETAKK